MLVGRGGGDENFSPTARRASHSSSEKNCPAYISEELDRAGLFFFLKKGRTTAAGELDERNLQKRGMGLATKIRAPNPSLEDGWTSYTVEAKTRTTSRIFQIQKAIFQRDYGIRASSIRCEA